MTRFGIITPTFKRHRFLPKVFRQIQKQSYPHWSFVLISDGPDTKTRALFSHHCGADCRMHYLETPSTAYDHGWTPRLDAMTYFRSQPEPPDYVMLWDDDNAFYSHALETAATELTCHENPDLLILPLYLQSEQTPNGNLPVPQLQAGDVDGASFVIRAELLEALLNSRVLPSGERGDDYRLFDYVRSDNSRRIAVSSTSPIGRYDGLRFFASLRWKLRIPPLHISEHKWYMPLRGWLRG